MVPKGSLPFKTQPTKPATSIIKIPLPALTHKKDFYPAQRPQSLSMLGCNIRSIYKNKQHLESILYEYNYDVLLLNETWLKCDSEDDNFLLENQQYSMVSNADPNGYRGTAILFKKGLQVLSGSDVLPKDLLFPNLTLCKVLLSGQVHHLFLMSFYLPPKSEEMLTKLDLVLEYLSHKYTKWSVLIYTDLNHDIRNLRTTTTPVATTTTSTSRRGEGIQKLVNKYELQVVVPQGKDYTWQHGKNSWSRKTSFIDFFLTRGIKQEDGGPSAQVLPQPVGTSDHLPISIQIKSDYIQPLVLTQQWCVSKQHLQKLVQKVVVPSIHDYFNQLATGALLPSPLSWLKHIVKLLHKAYQPLKPTKYTSTFRYSQLIQKVIDGKITREWAEQIMERQDDKRHVELIRQLSVLQANNKMKDYYAHISGVLRLTTNTRNSLPISTLKVADRIVTDPIELANVLTDHFRPIFEQKYKSIPLTLPPIRLQPISINELKDAIELIHVNKGVSNDYISDYLFKEIKQSQDPYPPTLQFLYLCINQMLNPNNNVRDELPDWISTSRMIFLNKDPFSGDHPTLANIRPIVISSIIVKALEAIVMRRLLLPSGFNIPAKLCKAQVGFIELMETSIHITKLAAHLLQKQEENKQRFRQRGKKEDTYLVFIDFKSAYDSVNHNKLFAKLPKYGIDAGTISLIRFIYNSAKVRICGELDHNKYSGTLPKYPIRINRGTPQGSLISPILFNIYINDLLQILEVNRTSASAYADDLCFSASSTQEVEFTLRTIDHWCSGNDMEINWKKTKIIKLLPRSSPVKVDSFKPLYEGKLEFVTEYKYLGAPLDDKMTLHKFIAQFQGRIKSFLINIPKTQIKLMSVRSRQHLWKTYADCHLSYGSGILAMHSTALKEYSKKYHSSLKIALGLRLSVNNSKMYWATGIWPPDLRVKYNFLRTMMKTKWMYGKEYMLSLPQIMIRTESEIIKQYGIQDQDLLSTADLRDKFRRIFNQQTYGNEQVLAYKFCLTNWSDYYLLKLWTSSILDTKKLMRSTKLRVDRCCPSCKGKTRGDYHHFLDECALNACARKKLRIQLNGLFEDKQLSDVAFRVKINQDNLKESKLEEVVNYLGQYVEKTQRILKEFIGQHCVKKRKRDIWQKKKRRTTKKKKNFPA